MNLEPSRQQNWDWRAAGNLLCGGAGSGLVLAAAAAAAGGTDTRGALLAGTLLVMTGLALVWTELGRPWRFLNVFRNVRSSWMSRESLAAVALAIAGPAAAVTGTGPWIAAAAAAALVFLYSQARMLRAARGIAAWRVPAIVPLVTGTGIAEGVGLMLLPWPAHGALSPALITVAMILCAVRALAWRRYVSAVGAGAPLATLRALAGSRLPMLLFGTLLPVLLSLTALPLAPAAPPLIVAAGASIVLSGWALKFVIVTEAAYSQGFALDHAPARGAGSPGPGARPGWGAAE
jgi:phenylacetyl-CoA:acceptor oxidoreductase subunit 2